MSECASLTRRMTSTLMRCAVRALPSSRLDWAKAMSAEIECVENERQAFLWAVGCVVAGLKERVRAMVTADPKLSRWILIPEMLLCFVPLTLGWLDAILGTLGILGLVRLNRQPDFVNIHGGAFALTPIVAGTILGALGPLGLIGAFRLVVQGRRASARWIRYALIAAPLLYGVLILSTRLFIGTEGAFGLNSADGLHFWSAILFLSALPTLGAVHLLSMARTRGENRLAA